jgi:general secretion pathway protein K
VDGGTITGRLEDLQGRFNLNNLLNADGTENELARRQFERLLSAVDIDPALAGAVVDWLDPDTEMRFPTGGEDVALWRRPAYRTANGLITSVLGSWRCRVSIADLRDWRPTSPCCRSVPHSTSTTRRCRVGILIDDIDAATARARRRTRGRRVPDIDATFEGLVEPEVLQTIDGVSEHFLLTATVTLGTNQLTMRAVLQRDPSGVTRALFRSLGVE